MAKKPTKTTAKARRAKAPLTIAESKQSLVLGMLRRANGASIAEIMDATD